MLNIIRASLLSFVDFTEEELFTIIARLRPMKVARYQHFLKEGEVCHDMAIVTAGAFRTYNNNQDNDAEYTSDFIFEGNWIGDYTSYITGQPGYNNVEALEESEVYMLSRKDQLELYQTFRKFETLGRLIAERLFVELIQRKRDFILKSAEERYLDLIKMRPDIFNRVPQKYIASYLGIQPPSLSRIRAKIR